ncbi:MAG: Holliday junction branch migration protein RuvA [candidate division Zixibacteria bacterium]|jgi:Holliday junction DNA helicase RuvA|nr:Holliday junction branch migration protein RuvA [candidate division Zixibacteria bacterium]
MISRLTGKLVQVTDQTALVETNGVCYEVMVPSGLAERLRSNGRLNQPITFETIYYIEAGDKKASHFPRLVGFLDPVDREFFSLFTQVPGLGVKRALKSLVFPIRQIAEAIEVKDTATLVRLPGVGARQAEKIIAELHGKTVKFALSRTEEPLAVVQREKSPLVDEAIAVLTQLQYSANEARQMVDAAVKEHQEVRTVEELITLIFQTERHRKAGV